MKFVSYIATVASIIVTPLHVAHSSVLGVEYCLHSTTGMMRVVSILLGVVCDWSYPQITQLLQFTSSLLFVFQFFCQFRLFTTVAIHMDD